MMTLTRHRLGVLLLISLGLNLFFAGFMAARHFGGPPGHGPGGPLGPHELFVAAREAGAGKQLRELMQQHRADLREHRGQMRGARRQVTAALLAEPFDAARLHDALATVHARTTGAQEALHAALVHLAESMTPQQRRAFAERLQRRGPPR